MPEIRGVLLDLSGTLHAGREALPGAVDAVAELRATGLRLAFVSNTSRKARAALATELQDAGFDLDITEIFTAPLAARHWLEQHNHRPHLLIHPALEPDFAGMNRDNPDAVLLADAGEYFDYRRLNAAFRLLMQGAPLIATGVNRYFRDGDALSLDAGPFVHALAYASGREPVVTGKPAPAFFHAVAGRLGLPPASLIMVGDDAENDVAGAIRAGLRGLLVRTGKYRPGDETQLPDNTCVADIEAAARRIIAMTA